MSRKPPNRPGIRLEVGAKVQAQDYLKKWYPARIEKVEPDDGKLLVHFERWSHRYDEWIAWDSNRLRPLDKPALRREGAKEDDDKAELEGGEEVLARWTDCRYYPAKIEAVNKEGSYRVQFYDGVVRSVKRIHIKSMPEDAKGQDWVALVKAAGCRSSTPRTSKNSRGRHQGEDLGDEETDGETEEEEGEKEEEEPKEAPPAQVSSPSSSDCARDLMSAWEEPQIETPPPSGSDSRNNASPPSQRRRSQRLAPTSDLTSDLSNPEVSSALPQLCPSPPQGPSQEKEESGHHNYCAEVPPTTSAQPTKDQKQSSNSPSANHTDRGQKSPLPATAAGLKTSRANRHTREPILSSLRSPDVPSCPIDDSSQFLCPLPGCFKSFRKAKLLDYHLKYYHSQAPSTQGHAPSPQNHAPSPQNHTTSPQSHTPSPHSHAPSPMSHAPSPHTHTLSPNSHAHSLHTHAPSPNSHTLSPHREGRIRATSASLPSSCSSLIKRRRTVSSSASVSLQAELVHAASRCRKRKLSTASISSGSTSPLPLPPSSPLLLPPSSPLLLPPSSPLLLPPSSSPPQEPLHHSLLRSPMEPGFIRMEKRIKLEDRHFGIGRKKDRRERDSFKVKLKKKKKKKKKSKQNSYLTYLERSSSPLHHHGNAFSCLPSPPSKPLLFPRALLHVHLTGEDLSGGEFLEDSTTESLLLSGEELDLEDLPPEDLSETSQEIVRCVCQMDEENGFMIQCEDCMCWQHSVCMGLLEDSIPEQYSCYVCQDPPGQRWRAKYRHSRDWLLRGHMFGLSILSENYSEQNNKRITSTHQLLADLLGLKALLHGLSLKMDILQDGHSPSLQLWARSWVNSDEHQPMGGLPDCLHFLDHMTTGSASPSYRPSLFQPLQHPSHSHTLPHPDSSHLQPLPHSYPSHSQTLTHPDSSKPILHKDPSPSQPLPHSDPSPLQAVPALDSSPPAPDTYITSEHSYQKPPGPAPSSPAPSSTQQEGPGSLVIVGSSGDQVDSLAPAHQARSRTRACVQWQMNLLTHIEDVQNQLATRMDLIEKELDVLESWLDLSGGLEPPDPLARLPQLKLSIKKLLADLEKIQDISTVCTV